MNMLTVDLHRSLLVGILRDMYANPALRTLLGFKGGTAAMLFYDLPRFSVDLDFDLLNPDKKLAVMAHMATLLPAFGSVREATEKRFTLFFLLNYRKGQRNLKIEISKRPSGSTFIPIPYLGISMLVMTQEDMAANKLAALLTRKKFATRDIFDVWFFLKNQWPVNDVLLEEKIGMPISRALEKAVKRIGDTKPTELLSGLGELLDAKQKLWAHAHLIEDTIFHLQLYRDTLKHSP